MGIHAHHTPEQDALFDAFLSLKSREECYAFFEDLCTVKELDDMTQRYRAACMLLSGDTYEKITHSVSISSTTISRINRCIQYGEGGYRTVIERNFPELKKESSGE